MITSWSPLVGWFSLRIRSSEPLPGPRSSEGRADIDIVVDAVDRSALVPAAAGWAASPGRLVLTLPGCFEAVVASGESVSVRYSDQFGRARLGRLIAGPVAAALLHQRHMLPLHASAVGFYGRALVIAGGSASGKTEVALALAARGHSFLADDLVTFGEDGGHQVAMAGPSIAAAQPDTLRRWMPEIAGEPDGTGKVIIPWPGVAEPRPVPVGGFVSLVRRNGIVLTERLRGVEALRSVRRHVHLLGAIHALAVASGHLRRVARLLDDIPVFRVSHPGQVSSVTTVIEHVTQCAHQMQ